MNGNVEFGKCECCGKETFLERTYFRYDIKCECHSPQHFEFVCHCKDCVPKEPETTKLTVKTSVLKHVSYDHKKIIKITKHKKELSVQEHLLGKHREHCLCWQSCKHFKPNIPDNCKIAQLLFEFDINNGVTTPVWECVNYEFENKNV